MAQPFSYMLNVPNPAEAVTSGLQQGVQLASMMERADLMAAQRRQTDIENRGLLAKQARATEFQNELGKLSSEGFSARGLNELMIKYPEAAEQLKSQYANLSTQEKQSRIDNMMPIVAAVNAGDNVSARVEIERQIDAFKNSGKTQEAEAAQRMSNLLSQNPDAARTIMNTSIATAMGPDKYAEVFGKLEDQRREQELQPSKLTKSEADAQRSKFEATIKGVEAQFAPDVQRAELNVKKASASNMYSQISDRAARLGLDREKFADESARAWANIGLDQAKLSQLPNDIRKEVDGYVVKAGEASTDASRMRELADRFKTTVKDKGLSASMSEFLANQLGRQDAVSDIRAEYTRMRNTQVLKNLPPGPASDKDIAFASKGFPSETADPQQVASFLTGFAKIRELEAKQNEARAAWTSRYRSLGDATSDTEIRGVPVRAGETFNDFVKRYQEGGAAAPAADKTAAASAAGADVRAQADAILRGGK